MKKYKKMIFIALAVLAVLGAGVFLLKHAGSRGPVKAENAGKDVYYCPMHPDFTSDKPGTCPICGMTLVKKEKSGTAQAILPKHGAKKILYYRNPMDPKVTSPVPMKDSMGMDYVPVYEEETTSPETGVYISPERQQIIGVKKGTVEKRHLFRPILTVGEVAYDPKLYVAQEEYLQALRAFQATKNSVLASISEESNDLVSAAEKKLRLLGMSKEQIMELAKKGQAQENLFLPDDGTKVWVYLTIYENEIDLIKEDEEVDITAAAFPGEVFKGKIVALTPVVNAENRSLQVRSEIKNPDGKLRPQMFVNATINVDLGTKLAVPESAVMDTGLRKIVYLAKDNNRMEGREVTLGQKAGGYYEVLSGLQENDTVITSGNFLIDSESKLNAVLEDAGH